MRKVVRSFLRLFLLLSVIAGAAFTASGPPVTKCKAQTCCEDCQENVQACIDSGYSTAVCLALYNKCVTGCGGCE